jgi:hypothetical protein
MITELNLILGIFPFAALINEALQTMHAGAGAGATLVTIHNNTSAETHSQIQHNCLRFY